MENEIIEPSVVSETSTGKEQVEQKPDEDKTAIQLRVSTAERLAKLKGFKESYDDVVVKLLDERTDRVV
jgi:hypothetical protein